MFAPSLAPLTPSPFPCSLAAARLRNTLWLCRKSRGPAGWLSQEVRGANEEARCRGFSPRFGAARLPQETWVPEQPVPCLPLAAQVRIWSRRAGGTPSCLLPPGWGAFHLRSGIGLASGMRMESHGAEVPKTAWSLFLSSRPLGMARSQPGERVGGHSVGHMLAPQCESSLSIRLSVSRPALLPRPWLGATRIQC